MYVKIYVGLFEDPRILTVGNRAGILYIRTLCDCRARGSYTLDAVDLPRIARDLLYPRRLMAKLVTVELLQRTAVGWALTSGPYEPWPTRRCSREEAEVQRRRNRLYNQRHTIFDRDGYACVTCGATERLSIDHIIPIAKDGSDDPDNLQTLCVPCNSRKRDR